MSDTIEGIVKEINEVFERQRQREIEMGDTIREAKIHLTDFQYGEMLKKNGLSRRKAGYYMGRATKLKQKAATTD